MEDPEAFLGGLRGKRVALDEVHRLPNPSELLKIAADHFPTVRILATGSSTLGASRRFRDTLAGRKTELWLTPMIEADLADFGDTDLPHRLLYGGLPPFFLSAELPERDFQEWMDAYWAKDIQELFRLERRASFQRFVELLMAQSGGIFEATRFAGSKSPEDHLHSTARGLRPRGAQTKSTSCPCLSRQYRIPRSWRWAIISLRTKCSHR